MNYKIIINIIVIIVFAFATIKTFISNKTKKSFSRFTPNILYYLWGAVLFFTSNFIENDHIRTILLVILIILIIPMGIILSKAQDKYWKD